MSWWLSSAVRAGVVLVLLVSLVDCNNNQGGAGGSHRQCSAFDSSCSDCIRASGCQWCSHFLRNVSGQPHCFSSSDAADGICESGHLRNPVNAHKVIYDEPLTEITRRGARSDRIVQIKPQRVDLRLRKGTPYNFTFKFRLAEDYPIDLYYLMDLSRSMSDDKDNLARLGQKLAHAMRNLTTQFKLGFGSFVDKVVLPYVNVHKDRVIEPCSDCTPPYSFRNNLPLDPDYTRFTTEVNNARISGNVDSPEGSLDALMQAIVCRKEIGWRDQARKLLVISTDAAFHHAGDGRLAGIVEPHDGKCHLKNGEYTHYNKLDYPSIAQVNQAAMENSINIIFAVSGFDSLYKALSAQIAYSSQGMLDRDSSNVVTLVKDQYNMISSEVKLSDNVHSLQGSPLSVRYFTNCLNPGAPLRETRTCRNIKEGDEVLFTVQIEVINLPPIRDNKRRVDLNITTFQDTITFNIDVDADCDCEKQNHPDRQPNSPSCSSQGTLQCGVCDCNDGSYGNVCQCNVRQSQSNNEQDESQCKPQPDAPICSGQGTCQCDTCICDNKALSGKYCECNSNHCIGRDSRECSGRGNCQCGQCRCNVGYAGKFCECPGPQSCIMPGQEEVCSGNGFCDCGECSCSVKDGVLYTGRYCEECSTCGSGKCMEFKDCVQCKAFNTGPLAQGNQCTTNCSISPRTASSLDTSSTTRLCTFVDDTTGCEFNFTYEYTSSNKKYDIFVQKRQQCPEELDVFAVVLGVIGGVVLIGLLTLLLWKILTTIHDRREYARFKKESEEAMFAAQGNVLYKPATGTFLNPAFGEGSS